MAFSTVDNSVKDASDFIFPIDIKAKLNESGNNDYRTISKFDFRAQSADDRDDFFFVDARLVGDSSTPGEYFEFATVDTLQQAKDACRWFVEEGEFLEYRQGCWIRVVWVEASFFGELIDPTGKHRVCGHGSDPNYCLKTVCQWADEFHKPVAA